MKLQLGGWTINVFPLLKVDSRLSAYYITRDGQVFSTISKTPTRLSGSRSISGTYFTLNRRSYRADRLLTMAKTHPEFEKETRQICLSKTEDEVTTIKDRVHASTVAAGLNGKGWVIAQVAIHEGEQFLMFGSKPKIHMTPDSVTAELARLATTKPGTKFVSFKVDKAVVAGGLSWE